MKNKLTINLLAISGIFLLLIVFLFDVDCIFLEMFNIPCASCGLTRGFVYIIKGDLLNAIKMNLLSIPIFISIIIFYVLYFIELILKKDYIYNCYSFFTKHYKIIIFILIINWLINFLNF